MPDTPNKIPFVKKNQFGPELPEGYDFDQFAQSFSPSTGAGTINLLPNEYQQIAQNNFWVGKNDMLVPKSQENTIVMPNGSPVYNPEQNVSLQQSERWAKGIERPNHEGLALLTDGVRDAYNTFTNDKSIGYDDAIAAGFLGLDVGLGGLATKLGKKVLGNGARKVANKEVDNFLKDIVRGDIHDLRRMYHNKMHILFPKELDILNKEGFGKKENYVDVITKDILGSTYSEPVKASSQNTSLKDFLETLKGKKQTPIDASDFVINKENKVIPTSSNLTLKEDNIDIRKHDYKIPDFSSFERSDNSKEADKWLSEWYSDPITINKFNSYEGNKGDYGYILNSLDNPIKSNHVYHSSQGVRGVYSPLLKQASMSIDAPVGIGVHEGAHKTHMVLGRKSILPNLYNDLAETVRLSPDEAYAEIVRMRYNSGMKPGDKLSLEQLEKSLKTITDGYDLPFKIEDKIKFLDLVNKMPVVTGIGIGAAATQEFSDGSTINPIEAPLISNNIQSTGMIPQYNLGGTPAPNSVEMKPMDIPREGIDWEKFMKIAMPIATTALSAIPGVGGAISGVISTVAATQMADGGELQSYNLPTHGQIASNKANAMMDGNPAQFEKKETKLSYADRKDYAFPDAVKAVFNGKNKSMAEHSKDIERMFKGKLDPISESTKRMEFDRLIELNEFLRKRKEEKMFNKLKSDQKDQSRGNMEYSNGGEMITRGTPLIGDANVMQMQIPTTINPINAEGIDPTTIPNNLNYGAIQGASLPPGYGMELNAGPPDAFADYDYGFDTDLRTKGVALGMPEDSVSNPSNDPLDSYASSLEEQYRQKLTTGDITQLASAAPATIFNAALAMKKPDVQRPHRNPYSGDVEAMRNLNINLQPLINEQRLTANAGRADINNMGLSQGARAANMQNLYSNLDRNLSGVRMQEQQLNNQYKQQAAASLAALGEQDRASMFQTDDINARNKAAREMFGAQAVGQLGQIGSRVGEGLNNRLLNEQKLNMLNELPSFYKVLAEQFMKGNPNFINFGR